MQTHQDGLRRAIQLALLDLDEDAPERPQQLSGRKPGWHLPRDRYPAYWAFWDPILSEEAALDIMVSQMPDRLGERLAADAHYQAWLNPELQLAVS
jgi:hypothetical protein